MKKTLAILAGSTLAVSIAVAQGKPTDKPAMAPAAAPKAAAPAAQPAAKAAPAGAMPAAPAAAAAKPGAAAAPAAAPAAAAPAAPKPSPELEAAFKSFEGSWKCETKFPAGAMGPGSPETSAKSTVKLKKALGGFFYQGEYEVKKTKQNPGMKASFFLGYQAGAKLFTSTGLDDMGGYGTSTSAGFQGETITFVGDGYMMGQKAKVRETMTRKAPKGMSHKFEMDMGKGFQSLGEDECTR